MSVPQRVLSPLVVAGCGPRAGAVRFWRMSNDVTRILNVIERCDRRAASQLLPLLYEELRRLAARKMSHESAGQTLSATALVHEAYLRLVGDGDEHRWDSRGHFFAAAAEAMRRILIENARRRRSVKRGGKLARRELQTTTRSSSRMITTACSRSTTRSKNSPTRNRNRPASSNGATSPD